MNFLENSEKIFNCLGKENSDKLKLSEKNSLLFRRSIFATKI